MNPEPSETITVTKSFMPPIEEYQAYLATIWQNGQLTNQGPLLKEFETQAANYVGVTSLQFVSNGTLALQLALRTLDITEGEIITTPFTYVATTSAILWERCQPVFVDIEPGSLCMDADKIEAAITEKTRAIMAVHVYGHPCDVERIEAIAKKRKLPVIYDGAHAFGVRYNDKPLLGYGDIATCSFHATKPFHTIEGGCVIVNDARLNERTELIKRFGHHGDEHHLPGINAKASEFHAAMGLCNLKHIDGIIEKRKLVAAKYDALLGTTVERPQPRPGAKLNHAYYPVLFADQARVQQVTHDLRKEGILARRYFYPSLNTLPYLDTRQSCPISEDISQRILCLPMYADLPEEVINKISGVLTG